MSRGEFSTSIQLAHPPLACNFPDHANPTFFASLPIIHGTLNTRGKDELLRDARNSSSSREKEKIQTSPNSERYSLYQRPRYVFTSFGINSDQP